MLFVRAFSFKRGHQASSEVLRHFGHELLRCQVFRFVNRFAITDAESKIFGHETTLDGVDDSLLKFAAKDSEVMVFVQLCSLSKSS